MIENGNRLGEEFTEAQEYLQMGQVLLGAEKYEEAIAILEKAEKEDPMNLDIYMAKGIGHASLEQYKEARECFHKAMLIDRKLPDAYFQMGNIDFLEGKYEEGMKNYNQAQILGYQSADLFYNLALVNEEQDNVDEAIRYYTKASNLDEMNPVYMSRKASLQILSGKYAEALQTLEKLRMRCPEQFEGYHLTAAAYTMMEKYEEADAILKHAIEMFPDDKDLLFDRVRVLVSSNKLDEAVKILQDARYMNCTQAERKEILLNEAKIVGQKEELDRANQLLEQAYAIPEGEELNAEILYFLMNGYLVQKDYVNLLKVTKRVDTANVDSPFCLSAMYYQGIALKYSGNPQYKQHFHEAIKYYRSISMKNPSRIDTYLFRAMCYKELESYDKALESVDYVLLLQPENGQIHLIRGNMLKEMGRQEEAAKEYEQAKNLGVSREMLGMVM